jgi:hypothetical protein
MLKRPNKIFGQEKSPKNPLENKQNRDAAAAASSRKEPLID